MYHERFEQHKFDRRLQTRTDWISEEELAEHLASLPDVSDKIATEDSPVELAPSLPPIERPAGVPAVAPESLETPSAPQLDEPVSPQVDSFGLSAAPEASTAPSVDPLAPGASGDPDPTLG